MAERVRKGRASGSGRLRTVLVIIIVLLLIGMGVLGFFFVRVLRPAGMPKARRTAGAWCGCARSTGSGPPPMRRCSTRRQ